MQIRHFRFHCSRQLQTRVSSSPKAVVAVAAAVVRNKPVVASPPLAAVQRVRSYAAVGVVARGAAGVPLEHVDQNKVRSGCGPLFLAPLNLTHIVERSTVAAAVADTAVEQIAVASAHGWPGGRDHCDQHGDEDTSRTASCVSPAPVAV